MSDYVFITLDTTPPIISVEVIDGNVLGGHMIVTFSVNESATISASLNEFPMTVANRVATFDIPVDWVDGDFTLSYQATDAVGNESEVFSETIQILSSVPYVHVLLDTTPPTLVLGEPMGLQAGETLEIPFEAGGDAVGISAVLRDHLSREYVMDVEGTTVYFEIPKDFLTSDYTLSVTVVDDVGNPNTVSTIIHISGTAPPVPPEPVVGGARPPSLIPLRKRPKSLPEEHPVETIIPVVVWCVRTFELSIPVEVRDAKVVEFSTDMSIECAKEFEMSVPVARQPGLHFAQILNEDEELLLFS